MKSTSRVMLAALSVLAAIGFYVVALGAAVVMIYYGLSGLGSFNPNFDGSSMPIQITIVLLVGGAIILYSLFPRSGKFVPPGILLDPKKHPALFARIEEIAAATKQAMPQEVYLVPAANAAVTQRGGFAGIGSRRIMLLGLPALQMFSVPELQAVLAHEFGHFYGEDTLAGPWVNNSRRAIGRVIENMPSGWLFSVVRFAFQCYGTIFLRLTVSISRKQEYSADALAARTFGAKYLGQALAKLEASTMMYMSFWKQDYVPVLERGFIAPWAEGFSRFCAAPSVNVIVDSILTQTLEKGKTAPMDTHPTLRERLRAMNIMEKPVIDLSETPSVTLLDGLPGVENDLIHFILTAPSDKKFVPVAWDNVATNVFLPDWTTRLSRDLSEWQNATIFGLPDAIAAADLVQFGRKFAPASRLPAQQELMEYGLGSFGAALSLALVKQGWKITSLPGEGVKLSSSGKTVLPFTIPVEIKAGKLAADAWRNRCAELGIADEPFASALSASVS